MGPCGSISLVQSTSVVYFQSDNQGIKIGKNTRKFREIWEVFSHYLNQRFNKEVDKQ